MKQPRADVHTGRLVTSWPPIKNNMPPVLHPLMTPYFGAVNDSIAKYSACMDQQGVPSDGEIKEFEESVDTANAEEVVMNDHLGQAHRQGIDLGYMPKVILGFEKEFETFVRMARLDIQDKKTPGQEEQPDFLIEPCEIDNNNHVTASGRVHDLHAGQTWVTDDPLTKFVEVTAGQEVLAHVLPGRYPRCKVTNGGKPWQRKMRRLVAVGEQQDTVIGPRDVGGSSSISFDQGGTGYISFTGFKVCSSFKGIGVDDDADADEFGCSHVEFHNCDFDGGWDRAEVAPDGKQGWFRKDAKPYAVKTKWMIRAWDIASWVFVDCDFHGTKVEHAGYFTRRRGDLTFIRCNFWENGRTAVQDVTRDDEMGGGTGVGTLLMEECRAWDNNLGDYGKGGSQLRFGANNTGWVILRRVQVRQGFTDRLNQAYGRVTGTGVLAANLPDQSGGRPLEYLVLEDCDFEAAPDSGDREFMEITGVRYCRIVGGRLYNDGGKPWLETNDMVDFTLAGTVSAPDGEVVGLPGGKMSVGEWITNPPRPTEQFPN